MQLNRAGAHLALCDLDLEALSETMRLLENTANLATTHTVDVSDQDQMQQFSDAVLAQHGHIDILINNAGITNSPTLFEDLSDEIFEQIINTNLWSVYYGIRAFLPTLKTRAEASIITISSLAGLIGLTGYSPYTISKFGARALSESLAMELSNTPINIMIVYPGGVKTNIIKHAPNLADLDREPAHLAFTRAAMLTPDKAAEIILKAIKKKRHQLIIGPDARIAYLIRRLFPQRYPKILNAVFGRMGFG